MGLLHGRRRAALFSLAAALVAVHAPASAQAQPQPAWKPSRPVTIIVPYSPGGGTDVMARQLAKELARRWDQPVNVENSPGADGLIGTRRAIEAKPDGHTYVGGFTVRMNPDGTHAEIIGHNYRNSYEQAVTSLGDIFQNDNDDPPA